MQIKMIGFDKKNNCGQRLQENEQNESN